MCDVKTQLFSNSLLKRLTNLKDNTHAARSFHLDKELKKIYDTLCALQDWDETKKLMYWTMTLASAACVSEPCHTPAHTRSRTLTPTRIQTHTHSEWGIRINEARAVVAMNRHRSRSV